MVVSHAREGDIDDVLGTLDWYAYHKSLLINIATSRAGCSTWR
jgi:hypothetical protein